MFALNKRNQSSIAELLGKDIAVTMTKSFGINGFDEKEKTPAALLGMFATRDVIILSRSHKSIKQSCTYSTPLFPQALHIGEFDRMLLHFTIIYLIENLFPFSKVPFTYQEMMAIKR